jgi:hypothetical protein
MHSCNGNGAYKFFIVFFTQEGTPNIMRFYLYFTGMIRAAPQETVGEDVIEPGTAARQPGISKWT